MKKFKNACFLMAACAANIVRKPARTTLGNEAESVRQVMWAGVGLFEKGGIRLELEDKEGISL